MEIGMILLKQIIMMFIFMLIGVMLYKRKKLTVQGSKEFGNLLLYVVIPLVIIKSFCVEKTDIRVQGLFLSAMLSVLSLLLAITISYLLFKKVHPLDNFASCFSNAGFIGIPLVQAAIGENAVFYIAAYIALLNILQWTYGLFIMTQDQRVISFKKLFMNPIVISTILGCVIFFCKLPMPEMGNTLLQAVAGLNTPLAMLISGVYLAQISFLSMFHDKKLFFSSMVRLLIIPLFTLCMMRLFPFISKEIRLAILIAASAPVGSNIAIFASLYDKEYLYSVKTICLSTILSMITLPFIITIAQSWL